ncbi:MAG TPA: hypothetical protein PLT68_08055, partial [Actinomycetota bacterium]|nr:hypothetical protein [Actinomycetota bacterium]
MATSVTPIGSGELLLHVGVHKTGTTALQVALADARPDLAAHQVRYPGSDTFQHRAIFAGAGTVYGWQDRGAQAVPRRHWDEMVAQARYDGRTVISSEFLDDVDPATARRLIDDLGGPGRVRVVITLRSIGAILPSAWQQRLKAGLTTGYNQFLHLVFASERTPKAERFWYRHDQVVQVQRWADIVGPERTYAVVIPDGDRRAIFTAFEGLLDLPDGLLADRRITVHNRSMTAQEAEFVRRLNKEVASELTWDQYTRTVRRGLILNMVEKRRPEPDEARIETPDWAADKAQEYGSGFAAGIAASGVNVIGDPQDLARRPRAGRAGKPTALGMDAAVAATA